MVITIHSELLDFSEAGPLPDDLITACDEAWKKVQGIHNQPYFFTETRVQNAKTKARLET